MKFKSAKQILKTAGITALLFIAAGLVSPLAAETVTSVSDVKDTLQSATIEDKKDASASGNTAIDVNSITDLKMGSALEMSIDNLQDLNKILAEIIKYEPSIVKKPANVKVSFWQSLTGKQPLEYFLAQGYEEFQKGDYTAAYNLFKYALKKDPLNKQALYYIALCKMSQGQVKEAITMVTKLRDRIKDEIWQKAFKAETDPWVEAQVAFKIGGFDSLETYKKKIAAGNRKELHSDEYYAKYVNKNTWQYYSKEAQQEYNSIAGIDCGGLVQRVYMDLCKKNGITPPFNSKMPGDELTNKKYSKQIKDDGLIPPLSTKPGDFIILKEHDGWGHAFYFAGRDSDGRALIVEASGEGKVLARPMPDRYYAYYEGTYKFNDMDKIREKTIQASVTKKDS